MLFKVAKSEKKLQVIATPIGNLDEITFRSIKALRECECILCEDTRVTSKLLSRLNIKNKELISYQKFNENEKVALAINKIKTKKTILVSDAGYPCISDPGYALVNKCYEENISIEIINGPSSIIHSAAVCGLNMNNFYFNGFLPHSSTQRQKRLKELVKIKVPIIFFESVYRIKQSLIDIKNILCDPYIVVCRELTKINETIYRGKCDDIIDDIEEKGEFVVITNTTPQKTTPFDFNQIISEVNDLVKNGMSLKKAAKQIALKFNMQSSLVYNAAVARKMVK